jgi:hypothetical protein
MHAYILTESKMYECGYCRMWDQLSRNSTGNPQGVAWTIIERQAPTNVQRCTSLAPHISSK